MRSTIFVTLSFFAAIIVVLQTVATADPWITGVTPRLVGRGTTSEIVIAPWGHEAVDVLFYPQATYAPWSTQDAGDSHGIRCVGTNFDVAKKRLICKLEVAPNCRPGEHPFRVLTDLGLSSMGTIYIGPFPVVDEGETKYNTNDTFENAMRVEQNITVRGTLSKSPANDIDCFRLSGKAGERLSVEVDMAKMGDDLQWNPVPEGYDSVVAVFDPHGKRIAINDDSALNRQDPLLSIQLPVDGEYSIVLRRSMFVPHDREYALHIGNYFRPLTAFPLGGHSGRPLNVQLLGDPLGTVPQVVELPQVPGIIQYFLDAPVPLSLRSSPFPNLIEEHNQTETRVPSIPVAINGILSKEDEIDRYRIRVKKDVPLQVRVWASALGSPVDPSIKLRSIDASGKAGDIELEADDAKLTERDIFGAQGDFPDTFDPSVVWIPKRDGEYWLEIYDPRGAGGPTHVYRVEIAPPSNTLHIGLSHEGYKPERPRKTSLSIPRGSPWTVRLSLYPGQGSTFTGPIDFAIEGLPPGVKMFSPQMPTLQSVWPMALVADIDAPIAASLVRVTASPADGGEPFAIVNQQNLQRVSYSHYPWRSIRVDRFAAAVSEPSGFSVQVEPPKQPLMRGSEMTISVKIQRQPGCDEPLEMQCEFGPAGVGMSPAQLIPSGENSASLTLSADANAKLGSSPLYVIVSTTQPRGHTDGSLKGDTALGSERVRVSSELVNIEVVEPFVSLSSDPQSVRRGDRIAYRWAVKKIRPFQGKASVRMLGLPVGMSALAPVPTIDESSNEIVVELEASDQALLGMVSNLQCDVQFSVDGEELHLRTGAGKLRIDPRLEK